MINIKCVYEVCVSDDFIKLFKDFHIAILIKLPGDDTLL